MNQRSVPDAHATLGALLRRPYEHMSQWLYAELAERGFDDVRPAFSAVLRNLPPDGARVTELAARAGMTKQSMGYLVDQMAATGLVEIVDDPTDRRARIVRLTARGMQVVTLGVQLSQAYERRLATMIGPARIAQLRSLLTALYASLGDPLAPQGPAESMAP